MHELSQSFSANKSIGGPLDDLEASANVIGGGFNSSQSSAIRRLVRRSSTKVKFGLTLSLQLEH